MDLNLYFREIVYHKTKAKKDSVCGVFSYEAINVEEAQLGNLYLVGKISGFTAKKYKNFDYRRNYYFCINFQCWIFSHQVPIN